MKLLLLSSKVYGSMSGIEIYVSTLGLVLFLPKTLIDIIKKLKNERRDKIILNREGLLVVLMCG